MLSTQSLVAVYCKYYISPFCKNLPVPALGKLEKHLLEENLLDGCFHHHSYSPSHGIMTQDLFASAENLDEFQRLQSDLMVAALNRNGEKMTSLLEGSLSSNDIGLLNELNAIHWAKLKEIMCTAAYCGDAYLVFRLLGMGCDVSQEEKLNHETPIYFAVKGVNFKIVKLLVEYAREEILTHKNRTLMSPFLIAASDFPEDRISEMLCIMEWMFLHGVSLEEQDEMGQTALFWSAKRGNTSLMQWLLSHGANMAHRDFMGNSVLHVACASGHEDAILFLCEHGAINLVDTHSIEDERSIGSTAFGLCLMRRYFWMYMSLWKWTLQYRLVGTVCLFRKAYAWYYWIFTFMNFYLFMNMASLLTAACFSFAMYSLILWLLGSANFTYSTEPGFAKKDSIPLQFSRVSQNFFDDITKSPIFPHPATSSIGKLQHLEGFFEEILKKEHQSYSSAILHHQQLKMNCTLMQLTRHRQWLLTSNSKEYEYMEQLRAIQNEMSNLIKYVAIERQKEYPSEYIEALRCEISAKDKICVTCKIIKPIRVHHCAECARCVRREDHHCVWIDNCIGINNQRYFWLFLLCLSLSILWNYFILLLYFNNVAAKADQWVWIILTFFVGVVMNAGWLAFTLYLFLRTTGAMITNVTFYEQCKRLDYLPSRPDHIRRRFAGKVDSFCWAFRDLSLSRFVR
ncbi:DHHC zinc finger domain-containing protein [Cardiosporidium cionae]|uniref:Palmitoyltransferase n=1 Tax=Cardiosporidium cionae TaxID=476202 RepID=A0ABQ7JFB6_9APIC|nr:DHHC zinc finger domain-containing protein [Cardiosporidium cionae]|eukprot:KAF8822663.1 DHHC zinc finger domain-containing protein [Cardiosporidium cionae]